MKDFQWLPLLLGAGIGFIAWSVNLMVRNKGGALASWSGWLGAVTMRIIGLIGSALFLLIYFKKKEIPMEHFKESLLFLFGAIVAGLIFDLVLSLRKLRSKRDRAK